MRNGGGAETVAAGWIDGPWIYSHQTDQSGKYWIDNQWIWGPKGVPDLNTGYWIDDNWIWGPTGAPDPMTGFFIRNRWIYGPSIRLPFVRSPKS